MKTRFSNFAFQIISLYRYVQACAPKKLEIEAGLAGCSSNFVVDGKTARFMRGFYNPETMDKAELGSTSLVPSLGGLGMIEEGDQIVQLGMIEGDINAGGDDKRFSDETLARYRCGRNDPYGQAPMMAAVGLYKLESS